jgi:tRNA pseudouridine13 synthase
MYRVTDAAAEAPRAARFDASATGPLPGYDLRAAEGEPGALERAVLASEGLNETIYRNPTLRVRGSRRPYRVPLGDASLEAEDPSTVVARFTLPPGAFATIVLRELMKNDGGRGVEPPPEDADELPDLGPEVEEDDAGTDVPTGA